MTYFRDHESNIKDILSSLASLTYDNEQSAIKAHELQEKILDEVSKLEDMIELSMEEHNNDYCRYC